MRWAKGDRNHGLRVELMNPVLRLADPEAVMPTSWAITSTSTVGYAGLRKSRRDPIECGPERIAQPLQEAVSFKSRFFLDHFRATTNSVCRSRKGPLSGHQFKDLRRLVANDLLALWERSHKSFEDWQSPEVQVGAAVVHSHLQVHL
jgi:hypothetical protein